MRALIDSCTFDRGPLSAAEARTTPADLPGLRVGGQARPLSTLTRSAPSEAARGRRVPSATSSPGPAAERQRIVGRAARATHRRYR